MDPKEYSEHLHASNIGLSKLETFTMAAMQSLISNITTMAHINKIAAENNESAKITMAQIAIDFAKATLLELSKQ